MIIFDRALFFFSKHDEPAVVCLIKPCTIFAMHLYPQFQSSVRQLSPPYIRGYITCAS